MSTTHYFSVEVPDGLHLPTSTATPGAHRGLLFDADNKLETQADLVPFEPTEVADVDLSPLGDVAGHLLAVAVGGVVTYGATQVAPKVASWWRETGRTELGERFDGIRERLGGAAAKGEPVEQVDAGVDGPTASTPRPSDLPVARELLPAAPFRRLSGVGGQFRGLRGLRQACTAETSQPRPSSLG